MRFRKLSLLFYFAPFMFALAQLNNVSCITSVQQDTLATQWDTSFSISGINFPNDSIFNRAVLSYGSNYRLNAFVQKCAISDTVRIGFLGGSITAGAIASRIENRFSSKFCESIRSSFPHLGSVIELNAGIGATPSRFGCSRLKSDLLDHAPDIIFVDYAVNDWGMGESQYICSSIEGIIRQCLSYKNDIPVVLLFFAKGDGTNVQDLQVIVGEHYSLPMISYRDAIWPLIQNGTADWSVFFQDDPHPNDNGHLVTSYLMYTLIKKELNKDTDKEILLPAPKFTDIYQYSAIMMQNDSSLSINSSTWTSQSREGGRLFFESSKDKDSIILFTNCREVTLGIHMQSSSASNVRVVLDNSVLDTILSNNYSFDYTRFVKLYISERSVLHTIRLYHEDNYSFKIDYILYSR